MFYGKAQALDNINYLVQLAKKAGGVYNVVKDTDVLQNIVDTYNKTMETQIVYSTDKYFIEGARKSKIIDIHKAKNTLLERAGELELELQRTLYGQE